MTEESPAKRVFALLILGVFLFTGLSSCGAGEVLDLGGEEAAARLRRGDIDFILRAGENRMGELGRLHPLAPFYAGLLVEAGEEGGGGLERAARLYEAVLRNPPAAQASPGESRRASPREPARDAAAQRLLGILLEHPNARRAERLLRLLRKKPEPPPGSPPAALYAALRYSLGRYGELTGRAASDQSPWERAFRIAAALRTRKTPRKSSPEEDPDREPAEFFFAGGNDPSGGYGEAARWLFRELDALPAPPLTEAELAAVAGRLAVARSAYEEGLRSFRPALEQGPALFFRYPPLLNDLGRAFQYGSSRKEGAALFTEWERLLGLPRDDPGVPAGFGEAGPAREEIRYRLLFYAGRIERLRGQHEAAVNLFTRALPLAPDALQRDACIWYILNLSLMNRQEAAAPLLAAYIPLWHDPSYFEDILDQLSRDLTAGRQWTTLLEVFSLLRGRADRPSVSKYAYILGRAAAEGYIPAVRAALAGTPDPGGKEGAAGADPGSEASGNIAEAFFRIALAEGGFSSCYPTLASLRLGKYRDPLLEADEGKAANPGTGTAGGSPQGEERDFLLGFFRFGAEAFAYPYILAKRDDLSIPELRALAREYGRTERWGESIRLVSFYTNRPDYVIHRDDMELLYPRPFREAVEKNARETGIPAALLYGLIRTESYFTSDIGSRAGAIGLTQLMPATALEMAGRISRLGGPDYVQEGVIDLADPAVNIHLGTFYLNYLRDRLDSPLLALLAYNGGMGRVRRWRTAEPRLPPDLFLETVELRETREYGRKVLAAAAAYGYFHYGMTMEAVVADILGEK
ncbi:MAG: lytic transglycosylase domain-containing protein [Treponema sp.]|nr:lytic transglycosylase domain-containing protein [Treponema sp.]